MLHLSAKRHRTIVWWEDALSEPFWETNYRTDYSIWFIGWVLPYFCEGPAKNPSIWKESLTWIVPRIRSVRGENSLETVKWRKIWTEKCPDPKGVRRITQYSLNKDLQHLKWQRVRSWISFPDCQVAQDKQLTQYLLFPGKNGRCSQIIENSQIGMSRHLDSSTTTQMAKIIVQYGRPSCSSWTKSVWSSFGRTDMGKAIWENPIKVRLGENSKLGMLIRAPWKMCMWTILNWLERSKTLVQHGRCQRKTLRWENQHSSTMSLWVALKENVRLARTLWIITEICSNRGFPPGYRKVTKNKPRRKLDAETISSWSLTWKVMQRIAWKDIANSRIKQLSNYTKSRSHAWKIIHSGEEENGSVREFSTVCPQIVRKCLHLARIERPDILWSVNKFARALTKWTKACDKRLARLISYIRERTWPVTACLNAVALMSSWLCYCRQ